MDESQAGDNQIHRLIGCASLSFFELTIKNSVLILSRKGENEWAVRCNSIQFNSVHELN
jgi:hypothetical protein